jgi:DNA-binding MarR family transcriptional regulator
MGQVDDRGELARRAWGLLMTAGQRHLEIVTAGIEEMGLSKVMAQFLGAVCQSPPGPTNQLATQFGVDPGWVTDIVDRLEARGQLVRRPSTEDRRVKILEVTDSGRETFQNMEAMFATPPAELLDAPRDDLLALVRIAERLAGTPHTMGLSDASPSGQDNPATRARSRPARAR